jgi:hypothetical protein
MPQADMLVPTPLQRPQRRVFPALSDCDKGEEEPFLFLTMANYTDLNIIVLIQFPLDPYGTLR